MITVKKLYTLKTGTKLRKIIRLLEEWEKDLTADREGNMAYYRQLLKRMEDDADLTPPVLEKIALIQLDDPSCPVLRRGVNSLRHALLNQLDISLADWDFIHPGDQPESGERGCFSGVAVYLDEIRSPFNVGSIFRTAESLGVKELFLSPGTADPLHPRSRRTAMGCIEKLPWSRLDYEGLGKLNRPSFVLELGGTPVKSYDFPEEGILIVGSEEVGVSPECLSLADRSLGRVSIPLYGWKGSLNVSVAFGIVMNQWVQTLSV